MNQASHFHSLTSLANGKVLPADSAISAGQDPMGVVPGGRIVDLRDPRDWIVCTRNQNTARVNHMVAGIVITQSLRSHFACDSS